jgi:hypothetical protein
MKFSRRTLLAAAPAALLAPTLLSRRNAAEPSSKSKMRLGSVTYNIAKDWDVPTIIKNLEQAGFEGVEL